MKILLITGIFRPEFGGPATLVEDLATRLKSSGHSVTVVTYSDKNHYDFDTDYSFKIIRIVRANKFSNYLRFFWALFRRIKNYDVVYSLDWFSAGMPLYLASILTHKKFIIRVGGGYIWEKYLAEGNAPVTLQEFYKQKLYKKYPVMYWIICKVLQNAQMVVFNSDIQQALYEKYYKLSSEKTTVIYNATPQHKFETLLKTYKTNSSLQDKDKEIVFWGRFIKMKNVESLIQAFAKLADYSYKLILIGRGPTEQELHVLSEKMGISHRVVFMPPMTHKELFRRIANSAYVVIPSWTDISPHQVFECLAQDIPFLLTQENYLPINNYNFLKINPASVKDIAEKMNMLLDPKNYDKLVSDLREINFIHTSEDVVIQHMKLFQKVIKS